MAIPKQNNEVIAIHVQNVKVPVQQSGLSDPFEEVSGTFKAGFFTGVACSGLLMLSGLLILY